MTLVHPSSDAKVPLGSPSLHAFIVGVAEYRHLVGGNGKRAGNPLGLGQITTPQYTAARIAEWLQNEYQNSAVPLGSIELLISETATHPPTATQVIPRVDDAILANVEASFKRWRARLDCHPDNVAFFYFCGHGIERFGQFLLLEDFLDPDADDAWKTCIAFDDFRVGMKKCKAQRQMFFVDACRQDVSAYLKDQPHGTPLISSDDAGEIATWGLFNATTAENTAHGPADGVSYFGQAVVDCLDGVAAVKRTVDGHKKWVVSSWSLSSTLGEIVEKYGGRFSQPNLACSPIVSGKNLFLHEPKAPKALAIVQCSTPAASKVADIKLESPGEALVHSPVGKRKPIYEKVTADRPWTISVRFPGGEFADPPDETENVMPPMFEGVNVP